MKQLAWVPKLSKTGGKLRFVDDTLKGQYKCCYEELLAGGATLMKDVAVETNWAEQNFSVIALACTQRLAYKLSQKEVTKDPQGHVHISKGFLDIDDEYVLIALDTMQYNSIWYVQRTQSVEQVESEDKTAVEHKVVYTKEKWIGLNKDTNEEVELMYDYVKGIVDPGFLENVKQFDVKGETAAFIDIPPGDPKVHAEYPLDIEQGSCLHYTQPEDTRTCMTTSFANVLFYCNCWQHAGEVFNCKSMCNQPGLIGLFKKKLLDLSGMLKCKNVKLDISLLENNFFVIQL